MIYYLAKVLWDVPIKAMQIMMFSIIFYFMVGLNMSDRGVHFGIFYLILFMTYLAFAAFCRSIGTYSVGGRRSGIKTFPRLTIRCSLRSISTPRTVRQALS